jgi:hypothetical protein
MPEGLESGLSHQDLADLIAAIGQSAPPRTRKTFDNNHPQSITADDAGALHLLSTTAEIYGKTLILEPKYSNLGFWTSDDDQALWSVQIPAAGKYAVSLHYACDAANAGNAFIVQCGATELSANAASTGNWDTYRTLKIGEISLPAGPHQILLRPAAAPKGALLDLMEIELTPIANRK